MDLKTQVLLPLNSFRQNNLYLVNGSVMPFEGMVGPSFYFLGFRDPFTIEAIQPIPLDENWLKDLGLRKNNNDWTWKHATKGIGWKNFTVLIKKYDEPGYTFLNSYPNILYVHELQNLYHAITKQELNYKEQNTSMEENYKDLLDFVKGIFHNAKLGAEKLVDHKDSDAKDGYHIFISMAVDAKRILKHNKL